MKIVLFLLSSLLVAGCLAKYLDNSAYSLNDIVRQVNQEAETTWVAQPNVRYQSEEHARRFMGVRQDGKGPKLPVKKLTAEEKNRDIPTSFDARTQWPDCPTIGHIRDQSHCGSCWAMGATEAMSDRICIQSGAKIIVNVSAIDLVACCDVCGDGCDGGYPSIAWDYWVERGIVTGGDYQSQSGCKPYPFQPCEHHSKGPRISCDDVIAQTPQCEYKCDSPYQVSYRKDLTFGSKAYSLEPDVSTIQKEIMQNGPVEVDFTVYEDFLTYKSGVYQHVTGKALGGHAIRLLGWGEENGVPYWLLANSWNSDWGDQGYFKIIRGKDECGIESDVVGGLAR